MISPVPTSQQATVSFQFRPGQNPPLPTKNSTAIKHSPIVPSNPKKQTPASERSGEVPSNARPKPVANMKATAKAADKQSKSKAVKAAVTVEKRITSRRVASKQPATINRPRAKWSTMEDERMLMVLHKLTGKTREESDLKVNWADVAKRMQTGRNAKQCRDRWMNYLRPGLKKGNWDQAEENLIKEMYNAFGAKWCAMAKMLTNRAENDIKNKWYSMMRKQKRCEEKLAANLNSWARRSSREDSADWSGLDDNDNSTEDNEDDSKLPNGSKSRGKELSTLVAAQAGNVWDV